MHIGLIIKEELKREGKGATWLAEQLKCNRQSLYYTFKQESIDTDLLFRISKALNYDFFALYSKEIKEKP